MERVSPTVLSVRLREHSFPPSLTPLEYHSWNAGPRSCLGRALATYEGIAITVAVLQRFDITLSDNSRVYEPLAAMNMVSHSNFTNEPARTDRCVGDQRRGSHESEGEGY